MPKPSLLLLLLLCSGKAEAQNTGAFRVTVSNQYGKHLQNAAISIESHGIVKDIILTDSSGLAVSREDLPADTYSIRVYKYPYMMQLFNGQKIRNFEQTVIEARLPQAFNADPGILAAARFFCIDLPSCPTACLDFTTGLGLLASYKNIQNNKKRAEKERREK